MIAILDYDAGNLTSVELAVRHLGGDAEVTKDPARVRAAERVIFPGVGAAERAMERLAAYGLDEALREAVASKKPVLAICIGIQLLFNESDEDGGVRCLGLLPGRVERFSFDSAARCKVPHMGWNEIRPLRAHPVLQDLAPGSECYFVHSYYVRPRDESCVLAETEYGGTVFPSAVGQGNLVAMQFHPEKSGEAGLSLLRRFLAWNGRGCGG